MTLSLAFAVALLAFANGANDNFKGVATVYGSRLLSYRAAWRLAAAATAAGGVASVWLSARLLEVFSGKGLVPEALLSQPPFFLTVAAGAALTGGLIGATVAAGRFPSLSVLAGSFLMPLLLSPLAAVLLGAFCYRWLRFAATATGIEKELCLCVGEGEPQRVMIQPDGQLVLASTGVRISAGEKSACAAHYRSRVLMLDGHALARAVHLLSTSPDVEIADPKGTIR